ncbi:MAG: hypothetical protein GX493_09205 [Firmicutes bacterium]|nr:hypothetical protein [Bacillota bacterium]
MKRRKIVPDILILLFAVFSFAAGCLPAPRKGDGRLSITVIWGTARGVTRGVEEIAMVIAELTRERLRVTASLTVDQTGGVAKGTLDGLYPGEWKVKIDAATADGTVIYTGQTTVDVVSGQEQTLEMNLLPAPGRLELIMDITPLLAQGLTISGGRLYIYGEPTSNAATAIEDMSVEEDRLHTLVENLATKTYEAKVAIPNISNAVFISAYFSFSILPGQTTRVFLAADGGVNLTIGVITAPAQVTGLTATREGETVRLSWSAVPDATGYRVYRTNSEGRFKGLVVLEGGGQTGYVDEDFVQAPSYGGAVGYAVAALVGEIEGIRSAPVMVVK